MPLFKNESILLNKAFTKYKYHIFCINYYINFHKIGGLIKKYLFSDISGRQKFFKIFLSFYLCVYVWCVCVHMCHGMYKESEDNCGSRAMLLAKALKSSF